jgi:hypothetical protein
VHLERREKWRLEEFGKKARKTGYERERGREKVRPYAIESKLMRCCVEVVFSPPPFFIFFIPSAFYIALFPHISALRSTNLPTKNIPLP